MNMKKWLCEYMTSSKKKPMPILSFPGIHILGINVEDLVKSGSHQAECMKTISERFFTAAAFSIMDLSIEAEAFGSKVHFSPDEVPSITDAIVTTIEEAEELKVPSISSARCPECIQAIKKASEQISDKPVISGIIGPYSLAGRLLDLTEIMILCYEEPEMVKIVLDKATEFLINYAKALKEAGANAIMMAEPAAGLLSPALIDEFSTPYVNRIIEEVEDENFIVIYHNCGNTDRLIDSMKRVNTKAYSFGNAVDIEVLLSSLPSDRLIIGNIDPAGVIAQGTPSKIEEEVISLLSRCTKYKNFALSSGCDIPPTAPIENIKAFFDAYNKFYEGE